MKIKARGEDAYFAASNSGKGFYSYYEQCFDAARVKRVYAVKGGPGTGKSRFLRDVAIYAEARGWSAEYIYCSSDPDSLDGVILSRGERCYAFLDATAPHIYEPMRPGIREEIVNLGTFWDRSVLETHTKEIEGLSAQKSSAYRRAYRYLAGMEQMIEVRDSLVRPYLRREAIRRYAKKLMQEIPVENGYTVQHALLRSVGMQGEVGFDTYFAKAKRIVLLEDCYGVAQYLMREIGRIAIERRLTIRLSHDPVVPDRVDAILLCGSGLCIANIPADLCEYPFKCVQMRRFVDTKAMKAVRGEVRFAERMIRAMLDGANEAMQSVSAVHFQIETLYGGAMDFDAKEKFTKSFCEELFDLQTE